MKSERMTIEDTKTEGGEWLPTAQTQGGRKQNIVDAVLQQISAFCS